MLPSRVWRIVLLLLAPPAQSSAFDRGEMRGQARRRRDPCRAAAHAADRGCELAGEGCVVSVRGIRDRRRGLAESPVRAVEIGHGRAGRGGIRGCDEGNGSGSYPEGLRAVVLRHWEMTTGIYRNDCEFADPFVSFKGLKRFKQNVSNLGAFMEKSTLKIASWDEKEDSLKVGWRFRCVLALPWRPSISASGSTEYFFDDETGKICKHVESWNISPADGVRQLFKPSKSAKS